MWFSNCEVTEPSIVQWPLLWGRRASSLTRRSPPETNISIAITPTAPMVSAICTASAWARAASAGTTRPGMSTCRHTPSTWVVSTTGHARVSLGRRTTRAEISKSIATFVSARSVPPAAPTRSQIGAAARRSATGHTPLPS